jgi:FkbM family methyltransferase
MVYDRAVHRWARAPWPAKGRVCAVKMRGVEAPIYARVGSSDFQVMWVLFVGGEYDRVLRGDLGEIKTVLDLGANCGHTVRLWHSRLPGCRVVAVELDAASAKILRRNSVYPGQTDAVVIEACAAGRERMVQLDRSGGGAWTFEMKEKQGEGGESIPALTVPQILDRAGVDGMVDLVKCNIEGAEVELMEHAAEWIGRVRHVVMDVHTPYDAEQVLAHARAADPSREWRVEDCGGNSRRRMVLLTSA